MANKYTNSFNGAAPPAGPVPQEEVNKFCEFAKNGDLEGVKRKFREHGPAILDRRDGMRDTALTWAAWMGHKHVAEYLLDNGADINAIGMTDRTALGWAAQGARTEIIQLLLDRGAKTDIKDTAGDTPLAIAQRSTRPEIAGLIANADKTRAQAVKKKTAEDEAAAARAKSQAALEDLKKQRPNFKLKK
jgi:ankyrin repeat protein